MRFKSLLLLSFICNFAVAQVNVKRLIGTWVLTKVTYSDGSELPDESTIKHAFIKYNFRWPNLLSATSLYYWNGTPLLFEVNDNIIYFKTPVGSIVNTLQVEKIESDNLELLQLGRSGVENPAPIKFYFMREEAYQNTLPLSASDILSVRSGDTTYKMSPKIYALYNGESFENYLTTAIDQGDADYMTNKGGHLVANFVVSKKGIADSLKILEGINKDFDKRFVRAFNQARKNFMPAKLNGRYVSVSMLVELRYGAGDVAIPASFNSQNATVAYNAKAYDVALYYFDLALTGVPFDRDNLFKRGICKLKLGNTAGACEDWKKIKELGGHEADEMLAKYCK